MFEGSSIIWQRILRFLLAFRSAELAALTVHYTRLRQASCCLSLFIRTIDRECQRSKIAEMLSYLPDGKAVLLNDFFIVAG